MDHKEAEKSESSGVNNENESSIDTSPRASVSALRAKFAQDDHVMGMSRPSFGDRRAHKTFSSTNTIVQSKQKFQVSAEPVKPVPRNPLSSKFQLDGTSKTTKTNEPLPSPAKQHIPGPAIRPKPPLHAKPLLAELNATLNSETKKQDSVPSEIKNSTPKDNINCVGENNKLDQSSKKTDAKKYDTFTENKVCDPSAAISNKEPSISSDVLTLEKPKTLAPSPGDVYVKKLNAFFRKKLLPPQEKFGPPPLKPPRPPHVDLSSYTTKPSNCMVSHSAVKPVEDDAPAPPPRPSRAPPVPPATLPPRPPTKCLPPIPKEAPPLNLPNPSVITPHCSDSEELYDDAEVIEEESVLKTRGNQEANVLERLKQEFQELCNGAIDNSPSKAQDDKRSSMHSTSSEELYQDTCEEFPENPKSADTSTVSHHQPQQQQPLYMNKLENKLFRLQSKNNKEQKDQERRAKETEKLRKKFGLTGEEIPVDQGLVKDDSRGGRYDLAVKKGETVLIIRMENNPQGKWLAKNERGKIGYVELSNIEVDADSVKTVMTVRRLSMHTAGEELYSDAQNELEQDEKEAIYEETF